MKPLLLTIALLFSTPAWAVKVGCSFNDKDFPSHSYINEVKEKIRKNKYECDVIKVKGYVANSAEYLYPLCRFDREIVIRRGEGNWSKETYFLCVPKK